jgi:hypothetical protein
MNAITGSYGRPFNLVKCLPKVGTFREITSLEPKMQESKLITVVLLIVAVAQW